MIIPEFLVEDFERDGFVIGPEVLLVYEVGTHQPPNRVHGQLVFPPEYAEQFMPGELLWIFPKSDAQGKAAQREDMAKLLQVNKRFVIEIGSAIPAAGTHQEERSEENE